MPTEIATPKKRGPYKNNKRPATMDAATRLFVYYGYDGVTHEMIAKEAGIAKSAVGKLFGTKERLAVCCAERIVETVVAGVAEIASLGISYDEHTRKVCDLFRKYRPELRFLCTLMLTPNLAHIAKNLFSEVMMEKIAILLPYEKELTPALFVDTLH
ncbi:TetR/AcrR family transcriptional regulator, partial [Oscillospiraceae bacterium OttesenSCG-928-G22]|nr:TetR/AcrR family transcriptional regulator [Oscillospiraceae bacterium OttesenSCG-928-G22]